ncbi:response regulator receiver domain-containing protein [Cereibacter ovatus]|uniref:Response regulator receiver domain-containing protein n=2 Tax=Cereibacter ovatus TaxID=439529 RepID=A0A285CLL0_9RHOB|nr:response regulator receiver domain-containing protein [Cereibacter ovatus]
MTKMRLLLIDGDPGYVLALRHVLDLMGFSDPDCTATAREALRLLGRGERFDCIILDLALHGGAAALCRRIRLLPEHAATPILLTVGHEGAPELSEALAAGASDYISRMLDPVELRARLGMAARIADERRRSAELDRRLRGLAAAGFSDPQPVLGVPGMLDLDGFRDQLRLGLRDRTAIAFRIGNAGAIAAEATPQQYQDMLFHVASVILHRLGPQGLLLAHAGHGEFVGLLPDPPPECPHRLAGELAALLADRARIYDRLGVPMPVLQVGKPMRRGFFVRGTPERLLTRARETLRRPAPVPAVAL